MGVRIYTAENATFLSVGEGETAHVLEMRPGQALRMAEELTASAKLAIALQQQSGEPATLQALFRLPTAEVCVGG